MLKVLPQKKKKNEEDIGKDQCALVTGANTRESTKKTALDKEKGIVEKKKKTIPQEEKFKASEGKEYMESTLKENENLKGTSTKDKNGGNRDNNKKNKKKKKKQKCEEAKITEQNKNGKIKTSATYKAVRQDEDDFFTSEDDNIYNINNNALDVSQLNRAGSDYQGEEIEVTEPVDQDYEDEMIYDINESGKTHYIKAKEVLPPPPRKKLGAIIQHQAENNEKKEEASALNLDEKEDESSSSISTAGAKELNYSQLAQIVSRTKITMKTKPHQQWEDAQRGLAERVAATNIKTMNSIVVADDTVTFIKPQAGRLINSYNYKTLPVPKWEEITPVGVANPKLLNTLVTKLLMMNQIDATSLHSLVAYVNREQADLDVLEHVLPLIQYALTKVSECEAGVMLMMHSKLTIDTNDMKHGHYQPLPRSMYEAFKQRKLMTYLMYMLKGPINTQSTIEGDRTKFF